MDIYLAAGISLVTAFITSIITSWISHRYHIKKQNRGLRESHYIDFLHGLNVLVNTGDSSLYSVNRNKLLIIASPEVVKSILELEKYIIKCSHDEYTIENQNMYMTKVVKAIREDLKVSVKDFPIIDFVSPTKK